MTTPFERAWLESVPAQPTTTGPAFDRAWGAAPPEPDEATVLGAVAQRARDGDPEAMAQGFALRGRTGLPPEVTARNLELVQRDIGDAEIDYAAFLNDHPATARWLQSEANATVARDSWTELGRMERLIGQWDAPSATQAFNALGRLAVGGPNAASIASAISTSGQRQTHRGVLDLAVERGMASMERMRLMGAHGAGYRDKPEIAAEVDRLRAIEQGIAIPEDQGGFFGLVERALVGTAGRWRDDPGGIASGGHRLGLWQRGRRHLDGDATDEG